MTNEKRDARIRELLEGAIGDAYDLGHTHATNAYIDERDRADEGWETIAEKALAGILAAIQEGDATQGEWRARTRAELQAEILWARYEVACETYDAKVCSGETDQLGGRVPLNSSEHAVSLKHAGAQLEEARRRARALGQDVARALEAQRLGRALRSRHIDYWRAVAADHDGIVPRGET